MLITFSGLDGAGKSTLISWLKETLESHDRRVAVFHMNDHVGVYAYMRFARDRLNPGARRPEDYAVWRKPPRDESLTESSPGAVRRFLAKRVKRIRYALVWNKPLRRLIYPLDLVVFLCYRFYIERFKKQVLIMDRYFYDTLVDVSDGRNWRWIRLLEWITPTPTVPVFLDISPEESFQRKGEYSVEYLRRRSQAYKTVFPWVESSVTISNDDLSATKATLRKVVLDRLVAA